MSKNRKREQAKKKVKEALNQLAYLDMTKREKSIYRLGVSDGRKQGALAETKRIAERLLKEAGSREEV